MKKSSRLLTLDRVDTLRAFYFWRIGRKNTYEIAGLLKQSEAAVYNSLNYYRQELKAKEHGKADRKRLEAAEVYDALQG